MALPLIAAGVTAGGGALLGALGAREQQRQFAEQRKLIKGFESQVMQDINRFDQAASSRIRAQGADITVANQRQSAAAAASLARAGTGQLGQRLMGGIKASGAQKRAAFEQRSFAQLGETVARQRQQLRKDVLMALANLGAEPSVGFGALQGFAQALPGAADIYENVKGA